MNKRARLKKRRAARLAASAVAVAAVVGIAAAPASAAPADDITSASQIKEPKLQNGLLSVAGTSANDAITLRLQNGQPGTLLVDIVNDGTAEFSFNRADVKDIEVDAKSGDDSVTIDESNGIFTDNIPTTIDGGSGDDRLVGGSGAETLVGGSGNDSIDGKRGNDVVRMGAGDDSFVWDPGDGSDVVDGQSGTDTMVFNGANVPEKFDLSAYGNRLELVRDVAGITMDTSGLEQVDLNALGGADTITVNDISKTSLDSLNVDLGANDGQADQVIAEGTDGRDKIAVAGSGGAVSVTGLGAAVNIARCRARQRRAHDQRAGRRRQRRRLRARCELAEAHRRCRRRERHRRRQRRERHADRRRRKRLDRRQRRGGHRAARRRRRLLRLGSGRRQ